MLTKLIESITLIDEAAVVAAQKRLDLLTKPPGSLGKLERLVVQLSAIAGEVPKTMTRKSVIVMAGDHGVCDEGVSAFPQEVTPQMVMNFLQGGAAVNVLARHAGADLFCVDIGVKTDVVHASLIVHKVRQGTRNMAIEAAMTKEETQQAIQVGVDVGESLILQGYGILAMGEMGIGNTTSSAALLAVLGGLKVEDAVGAGTGVSGAALIHKVEVVKRALAVNGLRELNGQVGLTGHAEGAQREYDPLEVLAKVGGLEIAGLVGVILAASARRVPVVIDGFISSAAALVAAKLQPLCVPYMISSHLSHEQGHRLMLDCIGLQPILQMDMRLGEGSGAVLCLPIIEAAIKIVNEMATFESAGVSSV
jgi:nicotinate-nucleotide--dimethylbenzimidazole phosphoribosyltransferase